MPVGKTIIPKGRYTIGRLDSASSIRCAASRIAHGISRGDIDPMMGRVVIEAINLAREVLLTEELQKMLAGDKTTSWEDKARWRANLSGVFPFDKKEPCLVCDESRGVQSAHVIPAALGGIRTIPLCPNCHWNYDHGLMEGAEIDTLCRRVPLLSAVIRRNHGKVAQFARKSPLPDP